MLEEDIANNMNIVGPRGPRTAFYTTPSNRERVSRETSYTPSEADLLMDYIDPVDGNGYAWISDKGLNSTGNINPKTVGDVMDHDLLYAAYPELKTTPIKSTAFDKSAGIANGYFENGKLFINDPTDIATALHESQHYIQSKEGWFDENSDKDILTQAREFDNKLWNDKASADVPVSNNNVYIARDDEVQAHLVNRTLVNGIPKEGAMRAIRNQLSKTQLNPYIMREKGFEEVLLNNNKLDSWDYNDYQLGDYRYEAMPGTKNEAAQSYPKGVNEDGSMMDGELEEAELARYKALKYNEAASRYDKAAKPSGRDTKAMSNMFKRNVASFEEINKALGN